ncbi:MAG: copper homeostasis protein CutC [Balneolaceae bacterium]
MPDSTISLEIPIFSADDAVAAARSGADRLELCASYTEGGLTPGAGLLNVVKQHVNIPVFVMLRPVGGHFNYSELDLEVIAEELKVLKSSGADGFVFGILRSDKAINKKACEKLINLAGELPCTFHRAFDEVSDPFKALQDIKKLGFKRILTSGQQPGVEQGIDLITGLLNRAGDDIIIMPGGDMKPELIKPLNQNGRLKEIHASCRKRGKTKDESAQKISMIDENLVGLFKKASADVNLS